MNAGTLAITRAIGDLPLKAFVVSHPYTTETVLRPTDDIMILACDGVWDVMSDQDALDFVAKEADPIAASKALVQEALRLKSTDNITAMVVRLNWS